MLKSLQGQHLQDEKDTLWFLIFALAPPFRFEAPMRAQALGVRQAAVRANWDTSGSVGSAQSVQKGVNSSVQARRGGTSCEDPSGSHVCTQESHSGW